MKRIVLLSLFFVSGAESYLEHNRIDFLLMTSTSALLIWSVIYSLHRSRAVRRQASRISAKAADTSSSDPAKA